MQEPQINPDFTETLPLLVLPACSSRKFLPLACGSLFSGLSSASLLFWVRGVQSQGLLLARHSGITPKRPGVSGIEFWWAPCKASVLPPHCVIITQGLSLSSKA